MKLCPLRQISTRQLIEGILPADGYCFAQKANEIKGFRVCVTFLGFIGAGAKGASEGKYPK